MQTQPTPISQIISPNATPGAANRSQPSTSGAAGDFQRTLNRQIEQRQASRNMAQAPAPAPARPASPAAAPAPATPAPANETKPAQAGTEQAASSEQPPAPATEAAPPANGDNDSATAEASVPAVPATTVTPPADPAAEMLALVGSIQLAIQPPAAAAKAVPELPARASVKADGKGLATGPLLAAGQGSGKAAATVIAQADSGDFADSLGQAQGKAAATPGASVPAGKAEPGKLAVDAQLAATAKAGAAVAEPILKETPADLSRLAAQLQPSALQQAAAAVAVPADKLTGRVGSPAWDQQLGQKVVWMAAGGDQSATLTLNPPDLGPVQVVLTVTNDQADAAFMSAQPEVRQALEAAMPRLREMMSEAGIAFGSATVSAGTPEQQNNGERAASGERRGNGQGGGTSGGEIAIAPAAGGRSRPSLSAVDTFA
ncbi:flagellar hook-length control protein [Janthinobacterium sp. HH103]|uniref:flagellar hook-length control protein FliK n=1 Tax=unclassified Janthinobacterium TaxID=2610881 RepID=UPI0008759730|nr:MULTISPECIES: flagellar hook-length control protein FliK [unclassified Janthinobacterium]OEZ69640.1 flagellar hook-length control protein [Janthinobacterium sp. HH100]OEZ79636.1 flagellar hook-length control protein [Janthinobacterium sp. HH103]QOU75170.1 Flagellar hook-length control protein FliK [Janthinobacterium sp. HH102]